MILDRNAGGDLFDYRFELAENSSMSTTAKNNGPIPAEHVSDCESIIERILSGNRPDPEVARRVRERSAQVTEAIRLKHGELKIGTNAIRDLRDS